jgi:hypothetical protein
VLSEAHLEQRAVPECDEAGHRPSTGASAIVGAREAVAPLRDEAQVKKRNGEHREERDLRVDEEFARTDVEALCRRKTALEPCPGVLRSALKLVDLSVHGASGRQAARDRRSSRPELPRGRPPQAPRRIPRAGRA